MRVGVSPGSEHGLVGVMCPCGMRHFHLGRGVCHCGWRHVLREEVCNLRVSVSLWKWVLCPCGSERVLIGGTSFI